MKKKLIVLVLFAFSFYPMYAQQITLVSKSKSDYKIIIPVKPSTNELIAAKLLQNYIKKITSTNLAIVSDITPPQKKEILIGVTNRSADDIIKSKKDLLKEDGYYLYTADEKLFILGGSVRGIISGVTGFLEDYLHCRKYSPSVEYVPKSDSISIPQMNDLQIPPADIRIVHGEFTNDTLYEYFRKIVKIADLWNDGKYNGYYVHTLPRIIPSDKYFKKHPEYFSLINGVRVPYGQFCLTNPDVLKITIADLKEQIALHPNIKYWSVSQSDNYFQCECDKCKAIDKEEASASGLMLRFVNAVAKEFPNKIITTLAYQYTRKPPLITKSRCL